ncbi:hypothetical protein [Mycobacterium sp.]|jgi:hypothetical protein|uniref:hypothetical protein n=1 Tax=Mycobacterium sp. TaxID=1785 RepID=UPI002CA13283|nr:hypothetical protein [Mycobacterium sp.]HTH89189.1 hypothetical protein [Mycobacterium sp.]
MVTELQFIAVAVFLMWGLAASLCGLLKPDADDESADLYGRDGVSRTNRQSRSA